MPGFQYGVDRSVFLNFKASINKGALEGTARVASSYNCTPFSLAHILRSWQSMSYLRHATSILLQTLDGKGRLQASRRQCRMLQNARTQFTSGTFQETLCKWPLCFCRDGHIVAAAEAAADLKLNPFGPRYNWQLFQANIFSICIKSHSLACCKDV